MIASAGDDRYRERYSTEESSEGSNDYTDRRSLAISVPDYTLIETKQEKFHVNCHLNHEKINEVLFSFLGIQYSHCW